MLKKEEYRKAANKVTEWIEGYFNEIEKSPVKSQVKPGEILALLPKVAPDSSEELSVIMKDLDQIIMPGITHWQHPNFHAYFPANSSVESVLAENITSAIGAQCMIWETSPAAAELEQRVLEWLRDAMGLPSNWEGVIQDTASTATLTAILTAREVVTNFTSNEIGVPSGLRVYCSTETHSSIEKAVGIAGIGKKNLVKVPVDENGSMIVPMLEKAILLDIGQGYTPCCVVSAIGTTGTVAVDPVADIAKIGKKYGIWHHIDAAYAGTALLLPEYQWMIEGIQDADSFVFNPHKWMFTNFDCTAYFIKDPLTLIKVFEVLPEYLRTATRGQVNDYRDWGVPLGRRFRALKLWFVMRSYGLNGLRERLRNHIHLAQYFATELTKTGYFEIVSGPFLNFIGFQLKLPKEISVEILNATHQQFLADVNSDGVIFLSHTKKDGKFLLRMITGQTYIEERHIERAIKALSAKAKRYVSF